MFCEENPTGERPRTRCVDVVEKYVKPSEEDKTGRHKQ